MINFKKEKDKNINKEKMGEPNLEPKDSTKNEAIEENKTGDNAQTVLEEKLKTIEYELESYKDRFLRKAAEFENYKRRIENDQLNLLKYAAESLIIKLLPVIDDFERSLVHMKDAKDVDSIRNGISLVYDKLMKILEDQGVKAIEAVGKPFDVHYHEAIMQRKVDDIAPHTVIDEFEKGYLYKDRVIRHTKVSVSEDSHEEINNSSEKSNEEKSNNSESKTE